MIVHEPVQAIIWHCLNHYAYADAIFLAERWHAEVTSEETTFLLGTCYYRAGRINEAYWLLHNAVPSSSHTRFLLAKCAIDLNYYSEAENALGNNVEAVSADFGEQAPFALQLLAKVYNATERRSTAAEVHRKALHLNPFVWDSFAQLCNMGEKVDPQSIFQASNVENFSTCHGISQTVTLVNNAENISLVNSVNAALTGNNTKIPTANATPRFASHISSAVTPDSQVPARRLHSVFGGLPPQSPFSPSFGLLPVDDSPVVVYTPTLTDSNEQKAIPKIVNSLRAHVGQLKEAVFSPAPRCALGPAPRRSSRLFSNNSSYSVKENNKSPCRKFAPKSPSRKSKQRSAKSNVSKSSNVELTDKVRGESLVANGSFARTTGAEGLLLLLRELGGAYRALAALDCQKAIQLFEESPPRQFRSPWVQTMLAQAYYELADYEPATRIFADIRRHHPRRTEGMDIYGTCLWHLQREADLSALAQDLVSADRGNPISWLVAGNCFSLHKERDAALKFFRRAVQLAPDASYAHALLGHEYAAAEETEKALTSFRNAVRLNPRNYGAWFGIATVYAKQERWKSAETHFRRAIVVHPGSAVLRCHLGVAQAALGRADRALATLRLAVSRDPRNPLCRFQLASVLLSAGRPQEALAELNRLKDTAPRESLVYYLLGKVHNKLGDQHLALMHFSWATDLDPKGTSGHIKEGFDPSKPEEPPEQTT